ncbi:TauD/TfdA family dioxygenase [Pseudomonas qingdaonensis]|uniref:TauD/TfdA family dioxygenase n=1 Tax=Pseudomonas qingdaonensis TaxID=2056231 RepID=UPI002E19F101|nr:TauD/TfdA family dioxygenase [Pseudomonas qingdaonensis]
MIDAHFSAAVRSCVAQWMQAHSQEDCRRVLGNPVELANELTPKVETLLSEAGTSLYSLQKHAWTHPVIHLRSVFDATELPETPSAFAPVPEVAATIAARATAIVALAMLNAQTVSYGSENDGHLFVNLVVLPGDGDFATKSKSDMRGHTDGVYFPIRGQVHELEERFAPSPDFVCLSGLRNPDGVSTTVMPLSSVLALLSPEDVEELTKPQYVLRPQKTFRLGFKKLFGSDSKFLKPLAGVQLLFEGDDGHWIRFSHSAAETEDDASPAGRAIRNFETACQGCVNSIVIAPGDVVIVNNRIGLHGRSEVGGEAGGTSRWLLRTYGLDIDCVGDHQRYSDSVFKLYP